MSPVTIGILIVLTYICVFGLVNRICKCVEHCATAKSFEKALTNKKAEPDEVKSEGE